MSILVVTDAKVYAGGYNLSGFANQANLSISPAMLDRTVFGNTTKVNTPGLEDFKADVAGFMDFTYPLGAAPLDQTNSMNSALFSKIGGAADVFSLAPIGNAELDYAYFMQNVIPKFDPLGGQVGALMPFKLDVSAYGIKVVRGSVMGLGLKTATGNSAAPLNVVGGVLTGQRLYAALHVVGISGTTPTLDVIVRSAVASNMAGPTTRITFSQVTTSFGASWGTSVAGPITDQYYDMKWTISGTSPNYTIFGVIGVL